MNMVASTDIKFYVHSNNNAPQLQNAYGSMIGVLDACLVNGISLGPVSTLTAVGTTVTAVFSTAHNLMQYQVLKITGSNQAEYNGEHRILTVPNATSVTFQLASAPSVTTATGSITASLPSLGWEKPFSSTNEAGGGKAAYRQANEFLPSRPYLRVVDERDPIWNAGYAKFAKVGIVEEMADIDTMFGVQSPFDGAAPNKNWVATGTTTNSSTMNGWMKWYYAHGESGGRHVAEPNASEANSPSAGARSWILIGTGESFVIAVNPGLTSINYIVNGYGKYQTYYPGDLFNDYLAGVLWNSTASNSSGAKSWSQGLVQGSTLNTIALSRKLNGDSLHSMGSASAQRLTQTGSQNITGTVTNLSEVIYTEVDLWADGVFRGKLPFIRWLYQLKPIANFSFFADEDKVFLALNVEFGERLDGQILLQVAEGL